MMEPDSFYAVKPEHKDDVHKSRFKPKRGKTLSARRWHAAFSQEGYLDIGKVLSRIQRGGVHPSIKGVVWEFLLGCYSPNSTFDQRTALRQKRRDQYAAWKAECKAMEPTIGSGRILTTPVITEDGHPIQDPSARNDGLPDSVSSPMDLPLDKKVIQWKLILHQIGLDVVRTDRALVFYDNPENDAKLWNILSIYAWVDRDIGYCQGMNDLCSPMVVLFENEADAFWCFERLMRRMRENFRCTTSSIGVQSQLTTLSSIIKAVDPKLHQHLALILFNSLCTKHGRKKVYRNTRLMLRMLMNKHPDRRLYLAENLDGGEYLFAFRMLMVLFRREFSFADTMYLWELMWGMEYNPNIFYLYEEERNQTADPSSVTRVNDKVLKHYGKFERKNLKSGSKDPQTAFSIFLIASVLENRNKRLMKEAKGLDDVVKILNEITGNLDAKKACNEALKLHKKYLSKSCRPSNDELGYFSMIFQRDR